VWLIFPLLPGKPKVKRGLKNLEVQEGKSFTLEVEVYSEPEAKIKW